jgi:tRNA G10  N-methylase Trm11
MRHESLFILGRQPAIGRAELESLFGASRLEPVGDFAIASDIPLADVPFARIGSSIRLAKPLATLPATKWADIGRKTVKLLPSLLDTLPLDGKIKLGLSVYGLPVETRDLLRTGLELKKTCKAQGRSVRVVPNVELTLNTAQVLHNQLVGELGVELLFLADGNKVHVAQTVSIQDIDAYAARDQGRPKRDAFVGMLPPKLAQTIVNLGVGQLPATTDTVVLDPFCGTGVILQEALLMGYGTYGTDLEKRMVDYSQKNLEWLATYTAKANTPPSEPATFNKAFRLETGDATDHTWQHPVAAVACETYLGHPLSSWPSADKLHDIIGTCNVIIQKFLANLAGQIPAGTRLCLAVPAWQAPNGRIHNLPMLDQIEVLGYNRVSFSWASGQDMIYHRPDQLVARELLVITRK